MGITPVPVDPRVSRYDYDPPRPCDRSHVSAVAYVRAGLFVGIVVGILLGYVLARVWS